MKKIFYANSEGRQNWVAKQLSQVPSENILLDIGSGGQPFRKYCGHLIYKAHDFAGLDEKNQIIEGKYGKLDYISDICAIPEQNDYFDAILCTEVLEHVPNPIEAVREMARLLKSGGKLIITAPLGAFLHQTPYHFYGGYTPYWYNKFLAEAGFTSIVIESNGGFFLFFGQECQRVPRLLFRHRSLFSPVRWLLLPLELFSTIILTVGMPAICYVLDKVVSTPEYTVGYHVLAQKK